MNARQEKIHELLDADPFAPFRIVMNSGRNYDVTSPYMIATGKSVVGYFFPKSNAMANLAETEIASIETMETHNEPRKKR